MLLPRLVRTVILQLLVIVVLLFGLAGTWHWWQAWVLIGVMAIGSVVTIAALYPRHEAVLEERMKGPLRPDQPIVDKVLVVALLVTLIGAFVLIPIDVFRLDLVLGRPPAIVAWLGLVGAGIGWWITYDTMVANAFAAMAVTHQQRQRVIDNGPYALVRHPMYAGASLVLLGMPIFLGSWAATLAALVPIAILAIRSVYEERFLARELEGYAEYMERVPWRLVPGVW